MAGCCVLAHRSSLLLDSLTEGAREIIFPTVFTYKNRRDFFSPDRDTRDRLNCRRVVACFFVNVSRSLKNKQNDTTHINTRKHTKTNNFRNNTNKH